MKSKTEEILASLLSRGISAAYGRGDICIKVNKKAVNPTRIDKLRKELEKEVGTNIYWCKTSKESYYFAPTSP